jgi:Lrp/AsnC family transcriptional regulator, leucine-responsive regulatory protein
MPCYGAGLRGLAPLVRAAMNDLDATDRTLVTLLQADGRTPHAELGKAVGLAVSSVNERVRKLVDRGVITGTHAHVAPEAMGFELLAFVFVGWSHPDVEARFLGRIGEEPTVLECHHVTGAWNYLLKVRVRNTRMLEGFLAEVIKGVDGIERTETLIVLSSPKETMALAADPPAWAK